MKSSDRKNEPPTLEVGGIFIGTGVTESGTPFLFHKEGMMLLNKNISAEQSFSEMAANMAPNPEKEIQPDKPVIMLKRIGSTTYQVAVHFSKTNKETMSEKITRMIKNETAVG